MPDVPVCLDLPPQTHRCDDEPLSVHQAQPVGIGGQPCSGRQKSAESYAAAFSLRSQRRQVLSDDLIAPSGEPWIIRSQTEARLAAFNSAECLDELPACDAGCATDYDCDCGYGNCWDNTSIFFAADSWRTRADDDYPGSQGFRTGINMGIGWWDCPVRVQLGGSYAGYDLSGRDGDFGADSQHSSSTEQQLIFTGGVYRRSDICNDVPCSWGAVCDVLYDNHFGEQAHEILLTQARGIIGYALE